MDDPALVWTTLVPLAHGWRYFEEMLMPGEIDLRAMCRIREQWLQPPPQVRLDGRFQAMGPGAIQRVVPDHDLQGRAAGPERVRQPRQLVRRQALRPGVRCRGSITVIRPWEQQRRVEGQDGHRTLRHGELIIARQVAPILEL
jgi:hypothetical protein